MSQPESVEITPNQAAELLFAELAHAEQSWRAGQQAAALDSYVRALGLALQLGPAPTEQALRAILQTARQAADRGDARGLAALGPSLVHLVSQVDEVGALPATPIMEAWATVAADVGTLIGQVGLALALPPDRRAGMFENARSRAILLDGATGQLFSLAAWLDGIGL